MPPKIKKNCRQGPKEATDLKKGTEEEKENNLQPSANVQCAKESTKLQPVEKKVEVAKLFLPPLTPETHDCTKSQNNIKVKLPGFWSKKLEDLEDNETKNKKHGLYEFNGTDESESYKITKKRKQNARSQKKRQLVIPKCNKAIAKRKKLLESEKKAKEIHKKALDRDQVMSIKERKQLTDEGKKFTFSIGMQSVGITSTPAINKDNLVGASNFLFLSPIIKEDECSNDVIESLPLKLKAADGTPHLDMGTPKIQSKLKRLSCRRVLRNGKMLGT